MSIPFAEWPWDIRSGEAIPQQRPPTNGALSKIAVCNKK
jgi:hypothetical protein